MRSIIHVFGLGRTPGAQIAALQNASLRAFVHRQLGYLNANNDDVAAWQQG